MEKRAAITLLYADSEGTIFDHPELEMLAASGTKLVFPPAAELIPLPAGSRLFYLPQCPPMGWDAESGEAVCLDVLEDGEPCCGVAAFLPPAYTRLLLPAVSYEQKNYQLPLWAYTAVGWSEELGQHVVAARRVDDNLQWEPDRFDDREVVAGVDRQLARLSGNRLVRHLSRCAIDYHCFAAKNFFLGRWECPLPVSPTCNARCLGCLSWQSDSGFEASQERIAFVPTAKELVEVALAHLEVAENPVLSFGQGCEGDPILQAETICTFARRLRMATDRGTLNVNTNASLPKQVAAMAAAGMDSIRVSINSPRPETYLPYYRPRGYTFDDVLTSLQEAKDGGMQLAINLLVMPGVTDDPAEVEALLELVQSYRVDQVQMRNLNIDPQLYLETLNREWGEAMGIGALIDLLKRECPGLAIGYFNRYLG
ncbi:MAG: radical SAM protein [Deltaproteobacteria bacterium]|nr:radical SAM protein [Candidatus Anaeroferrophillus wilburensis]MBN2889227.1 radical SAM protein [Deltaproteobacteria bacterium]